MADIRAWLEGLGLGEYADAFEAERIELDDLARLDAADLKEMGLPMGPRKRLLEAIGASVGTSKAGQGADALGAAADKPVQRDAERRQLTVMFCDLVGSTELSQKLDPEALRELMRAYQQACGQVIEKYDGHVAQYLGDGLMVYLGWPRAHEDDAERAIRAGLEIVSAVKRVDAPEPLHVRIGIATGPVVVGETGAGDASVPKVAVGETPNLAARVQGLARPDEIVIATTTHRLVGDAFAYADLGSHTLKGIVEPVRVWRVAGLAATEGRFEATRGAHLTPLVGREAEVALLMEKWTQACDGEGQVVLVCGEPGIGKSRIMQVVRSRIEAHLHTRLRYQCSPYHTNSALYPVIEQLARAASFEPSDETPAKLAKLEALVGTDGLTPALLAALLGLDAGDRYSPLNMTPQKQKDETLKALVDQVTMLAAEKPVLMLFEDVHWIDPTSQETLDLIVPQLADKRVLLLITYRPEYTPPWPQSLGHVTTLNLSRLGRRQAAELVARVTGGRALPDEILDQIVAKTDGVPLFVEELTKTVLESGLVAEEGGVYRLVGVAGDLSVPSTLKDSLMARLDRLSPVKEVAQIGACIGREFPYDLLAAVSDLGKEALQAALQQLVKSELVFRAGTPPQATYTFKHALVQDAAYDSLLKSRRHLLHQRIGQTLESSFPQIAAAQPEVLFRHLSVAGLIEAAVPYAIKAGQAAMARGAPASAMSHLSAGLTLLEQLPLSSRRDELELDLRLDLGTAYIFARGYAYAEIKPNYDRCRELVALTPDNEKAFNATLGLFYYYNVINMRPESNAIADELLKMATRSDDPQQLLLTYQARGQCLLFQARFADAVEALERSLSYYDNERDPALVQIWGGDFKCMDLSIAAFGHCVLGHLDRALELVQESESYAEQLGQPVAICNSRLFYPLVRWMRGEYDRTIASASQGLAIAKENGFGFYIAYLGIYAAAGHCGAGDPQRCVAMFEEADPIANMVGARIQRRLIAAALAPAFVELGNCERALALVDDTIAECQSCGDYYFDSYLLTVRALIQQSLGAADAAEQDLLQALGMARAQSAKYFELRAATPLARMWQSQGKAGAAYDLLAPIYGWFTEGLDTLHLTEAKALLDELEAQR